MKTFFIVILAATFLRAEEFTKKDGSKINASVLKYTPGVIQLKSNDGTIKDYSEKDFKAKSLAKMLPKDNIYDLALSVLERLDDLSKQIAEQEVSFSNKISAATSNAIVCLDKHIAVLNIIKKYEKDRLLPESFSVDISKALSDALPVKPAAKQKNKYNIPDDIYKKIQSEAASMFPNDYSMQMSRIENEVKSYKKLKESE